MYIKLAKNLNISKFIKEEELFNHIDTKNEWFTSMCYYTDAQVQEVNDRLKSTGKFSVAGMSELVTNKLWWDFDSKDDLNKAKSDTIALCQKLLDTGFKEENIQICFSGNKGFSVVVETDRLLKPKEVEDVCTNLAKDLSSFDTTMYDAPQVFRVPLTINKKTNLFKMPMQYTELSQTTIDTMKDLAKDVSDIAPQSLKSYYKKATWPTKLIIKKEQPVKTKTTKYDEVIDFTAKPSFLTNCRWALQNGEFTEGHRSHALLCLAATYKNLKFDIEHVYRLLKGVCELQARRHNQERFPDDELYNTICMQVFSPTWKGGQYSCRQKGWLQNYCQSLGNNCCENKVTDLTIECGEVFSLFKNYATNYEQNILYTGIKELDENAKLMVGTSNGFLGAPGCGKSSFSLQLLQHNSEQNNQSIFFSYDMFHANLYVRMLQRHTGFNQDIIYDIFRNDPKKAAQLNEELKQAYKNVKFCFKSGQTPDEIRETIITTEQNTGKKVKLCVVDYNELVVADTSDPTAASAQVVQRLRQIANEQEVCILTLLQPSKLYSSPTEDIVSFNSAKGSSAIAQSLTLMYGCSRPGFDPKNPQQDKFFNITCLKNRNGPLFSVDLKWDGLRGALSSLEDNEYAELEDIRARKKKEKEDKSGW